jgi:hypothetical protein
MIGASTEDAPLSLHRYESDGVIVEAPTAKAAAGILAGRLAQSIYGRKGFGWSSNTGPLRADGRSRSMTISYGVLKDGVPYFAPDQTIPLTKLDPVGTTPLPDFPAIEAFGCGIIMLGELEDE